MQFLVLRLRCGTQSSGGLGICGDAARRSGAGGAWAEVGPFAHDAAPSRNAAKCSCKTNVGGIPVLRLSPTGNPIPGCGCAGGSRRKLGKRAHPLPPPAPQNLAPRALAARFRPPPPGPLTSLSPAKIAANRSVYAVHSVWPPSIHKKARRGRHVARRREGGLSRRPAPAADASAECAIERNGRFVGA
ncbi:unnamed protein product [Spodoptera exigua]|nr:unnamed protein product [Spodoptera exigua]